MSLPVAVRVLTSLVAAALACAAGMRAHADAAYRRGLGYTDRPAADVPGRIEAYEEAVRRSPGCFTYRLRAGQIHLARALAERGGDGASLDAASRHLHAAAATHPLDARVHVALARLLLLEGDVDGALTEARRAVAVGPRHPSAQVAAVSVCARAWALAGRVDALTTALDLERAREEWQDGAGTPREVRSVLRARAHSALGDVLEACAGDAVRLATAHRWLSAALPDLAPALDDALQRARGRE